MASDSSRMVRSADSRMDEADGFTRIRGLKLFPKTAFAVPDFEYFERAKVGIN